MSWFDVFWISSHLEGLSYQTLMWRFVVLSVCLVQVLIENRLHQILQQSCPILLRALRICLFTRVCLTWRSMLTINWLIHFHIELIPQFRYQMDFAGEAGHSFRQLVNYRIGRARMSYVITVLFSKMFFLLLRIEFRMWRALRVT